MRFILIINVELFYSGQAISKLSVQSWEQTRCYLYIFISLALLSAPSTLSNTLSNGYVIVYTG